MTVSSSASGAHEIAIVAVRDGLKLAAGRAGCSVSKLLEDLAPELLKRRSTQWNNKRLSMEQRVISSSAWSTLKNRVFRSKNPKNGQPLLGEKEINDIYQLVKNAQIGPLPTYDRRRSALRGQAKMTDQKAAEIVEDFLSNQREPVSTLFHSERLSELIDTFSAERLTLNEPSKVTDLCTAIGLFKRRNGAADKEGRLFAGDMVWVQGMLAADEGNDVAAGRTLFRLLGEDAANDELRFVQEVARMASSIEYPAPTGQAEHALAVAIAGRLTGVGNQSEYRVVVADSQNVYPLPNRMVAEDALLSCEISLRLNADGRANVSDKSGIARLSICLIEYIKTLGITGKQPFVGWHADSVVEVGVKIERQIHLELATKQTPSTLLRVFSLLIHFTHYLIATNHLESAETALKEALRLAQTIRLTSITRWIEWYAVAARFFNATGNLKAELLAYSHIPYLWAEIGDFIRENEASDLLRKQVALQNEAIPVQMDISADLVEFVTRKPACLNFIDAESRLAQKIRRSL